ncbi:hypothetical protein N7539_001899 [Penicillium diatomitis]|uniref:Uncharacterized protein n=1 Tax=Penicillium diatomitis TaxID=2819901 RepID=A0A9W9XHV9_9EURO|nr:uncharacterized protein N7539_001899 [Penicillium diatomitis]KAJ5493153.1 hypothetical protein N7539_001899 [Penicillium diatomitis]
MAWYSILPPQLIQFESWVVRVSLLLALFTIGPWAALIAFDACLYLYRMIIWEMPGVGGRARGQQRPRAPSLQERPDGQRRAFGVFGSETDIANGDLKRRENGRSERRESLAKTEPSPIEDKTPYKLDSLGDVAKRRMASPQ